MTFSMGWAFIVKIWQNLAIWILILGFGRFLLKFWKAYNSLKKSFNRKTVKTKMFLFRTIYINLLLSKFIKFWKILCWEGVLEMVILSQYNFDNSLYSCLHPTGSCKKINYILYLQVPSAPVTEPHEFEQHYCHRLCGKEGT
jgi:hypothetical protein